MQAEKYLTEIRLFRYKEISSEQSLSLYFKNLNVSGLVLTIISLFEVVLRNKVHIILQQNMLTKNYLTKPKIISLLTKREKTMIEKAKKDSSKFKLNNIEGKMLTLLTLSFWCVLFENNSLWCHSLYLVFPKKVRQENSIRAINMKLKDILRLRNKIAHHERIVHKKGTAIYKTVEDIKLILNWLIENDDDEFYQYIKCFIDSKMEEIKNLLVR